MSEKRGAREEVRLEKLVGPGLAVAAVPFCPYLSQQLFPSFVWGVPSVHSCPNTWGELYPEEDLRQQHSHFSLEEATRASHTKPRKACSSEDLVGNANNFLSYLFQASSAWLSFGPSGRTLPTITKRMTLYEVLAGEGWNCRGKAE